MAKLIELKGISKSYDGEKVIDGMNLYIRDGEFITLLGPSGCGKTTTLRIIGGFETADEGSLYFDGVEISEKIRNIAAENVRAIREQNRRDFRF